MLLLLVPTMHPSRPPELPMLLDRVHPMVCHTEAQWLFSRHIIGLTQSNLSLSRLPSS